MKMWDGWTGGPSSSISMASETAKVNKLRALRSTVIAGVIWSSVRNLIVIAVAIGLYGVLENRFETIVVSILLIIYATIGLHAGNFEMTAGLALAYLENIKSEMKSAAGTTAEQKPLDELSRLFIRIVIGTWTLGIMQLIALWHLIKAIGWV